MSDDTIGVSDAIKALMRAQQDKLDRERAAFDDAVQNAVAKSEDVHKALLDGLTTDPPWRPSMMAWAWMQHDPAKWEGYHPEQCMNIAKMFGIGEAV